MIKVPSGVINPEGTFVLYRLIRRYSLSFTIFAF